MNRHAAALYRSAPVWAQNLLLSGYGKLLARERNGGSFERYQTQLAASQWMSRAAIGEYQNERLRVVISHAYEHVPFYRKRFDALRLKPSDIRSPQDLPKLPLLTRDDVRHSFEDLCSRAVSRRTLKTGHTSGTTGTPLTVGYDAETIWMTYAVFDRHYHWAGCRFGRDGDRVAVARGNVIVPLSQKSAPFWRYNTAQHQLILSSFHMSPATLGEYFEVMTEFKPDVVDGYPSTLYLMAKYLERQGRTFPVRAAVTSSETLFDFQRALIEERFACRVFDYYALAERTVFSSECDRHEGHHLAEEYGVTEITTGSGEPVADGVVGRLVSTSLHNLAMPLIRYATTDMTSMKPSACTCGRALRLVDDVTTKAEDTLTLPDGRLIPPSVLTHPFKPLDCIDGSQIVQTAPDNVIVKLVAGPALTEAHTRQLVTELAARLGDNVRITIERVDRLEMSANGKFKWVISRVPLGL